MSDDVPVFPGLQLSSLSLSVSSCDPFSVLSQSNSQNLSRTHADDGKGSSTSEHHRRVSFFNRMAPDAEHQLEMPDPQLEPPARDGRGERSVPIPGQVTRVRRKKSRVLQSSLDIVFSCRSSQ